MMASSHVGKVCMFGSNIMWAVDRFCGTCKNVGDAFLSPIFSVCNINNKIVDFQMQLFPRGSTIANGGTNISIYLYNRSEFDVTIGYQLSLMNNKDIHLCKKENQGISLGRNQRSGFSDFAKLDVVMDTRNGILNNTQLLILCSITDASTLLLNHRKLQEIGTNNKIEEITRLGRILDNFETMYFNGVFSDVIVTTADGKDFRLHKCVLASCSTVFRAMLDSAMKESNQNSIVIEDFSYEIMGQLFRFMYTGKVDQIETVAEGLLKAAHKYSIEDLMVMCEKTLCKKLTLDNVLEYLILSDLYSAKNLKTEAIRYIVFHGKNIVEKPEFKASVNVETACEIISAIFANNKK